MRYHSLVIDPSSLPKDLIPIAWTSSHETIPFLDGFEGQGDLNTFAKSLSTKFDNGLHRHPAKSQELRTRDILMGIMHCSRPHYGLQVNCHPTHKFFDFGVTYSTINWLCLFGSSFIQRALLHTMEGKYSRILRRSRKTIGPDCNHPQIA